MNKACARLVSLLLFLFVGLHSFAEVKPLPDKPSPPRLVNDMAHMLSEAESAQLEAKLVNFETTTSNEITIVTVESLEDYDVSDYAIKLGKAWGIGKSGKNNGVVILASFKDHKINISTGKGLEGALTDLTCGRIIRNEMVPAFKAHDYFTGFSKAADAVIAATKGEYKGEPKKAKNLPFSAIIVIIIVIIFVVRMFGRGGGGGGGNYMRGGGLGNFATGMLIGELLGGGRRGGGGGWGGGGDSGGGGFGGFGGGDFGGGGASGSW
ncbi:MAG: methanol dehydrogenase [Flavipsychrobacter sp.]|nr:methanol dehydrogenase [Flavipsychrobacter sp.]